jgi:TetR/AcrR family transcriptional repressor of nem operon
MSRTRKDSTKKTSREKLLESAFSLIRNKGYASTAVGDQCDAAGVRKGTFFQYFESKVALGVSAAQHWLLVTTDFPRSAPYHSPEDPLERLLGNIESRKEILRGKTSEFTCLFGTLLQETYNSNPEIRKVCKESIGSSHPVSHSRVVYLGKSYGR